MSATGHPDTPEERTAAVYKIAVRMCAQAGLNSGLVDAFVTEAWLEYLGSDVKGRFAAPQPWSLDRDKQEGDQAT